MTGDPTDLAAAEQAEREARLAQLAAQRLLQDDLTWWFSDKRGLRIAEHLLEMTRPFESPWCGDVRSTDVRCGEQKVGHWLIGMLSTIAPDQLVRMMRKGNDRAS